MSNNEAKFLLNAYRPGGADAADPAFADALQQTKADPALAAWFAREQAHAAAVAAKLREIAPPPGLRDAILAGGRATERAVPSMRSRGLPVRWLALAASVALLASLSVVFWPKPAASAEALTVFAVDDVLHGRHGGHGVPEKTLQTELSQTSTHLGAGVPIDFRTLAGTGCRTLHFAGRDILEVCFVRNGAEFHCYIGRASDFSGGSAPDEGPQFVQQGALAAATWTSGIYRYVVVGDAGLEAVKRLL